MTKPNTSFIRGHILILYIIKKGKKHCQLNYNMPLTVRYTLIAKMLKWGGKVYLRLNEIMLEIISIDFTL